jgi:DNA-binding NtrC family response regulator
MRAGDPSSTPRAAAGGPKTILVADDDAEVRQLVAEFLAREGYEVLQAANGLETLLHVKRARPAAVVLDLGMPRLGGLDALRRISAFDPAITVVVVTGETDPEVHRKALALGARAVLAKPIALPALLAALSATPARAAAAEEHEAAARPGAEHRATATPVLIVDDDADVRATLEEHLTRRGYHVRSVADGAAAVRAIVENPPAVVLLDIRMPGLSGLEALQTIRAVAPECLVIMVSGEADLEVARRALAHGAFDYVGKPVDFAYLAQSLEAAITMKGLKQL